MDLIKELGLHRPPAQEVFPARDNDVHPQHAQERVNRLPASMYSLPAKSQGPQPERPAPRKRNAR